MLARFAISHGLFVVNPNVEAMIERHGEQLQALGAAKRLQDIERWCRRLASFDGVRTFTHDEQTELSNRISDKCKCAHGQDL